MAEGAPRPGQEHAKRTAVAVDTGPGNAAGQFGGTPAESRVAAFIPNPAGLNPAGQEANRPFSDISTKFAPGMPPITDTEGSPGSAIAASEAAAALGVTPHSDEGTREIADKAEHKGRIHKPAWMSREALTARFGLKGKSEGPAGSHEVAVDAQVASPEALVDSTVQKETIVEPPIPQPQVAQAGEQPQSRTDTSIAAGEDLVFGVAQRQSREGRKEEIAGFGRSEEIGFTNERRAQARRDRKEARQDAKKQRLESHEGEEWGRTKAIAEGAAARASRTPEAMRRISGEVSQRSVEAVRFNSHNARVVTEEGLRVAAAGSDQAIPADVRGRVRDYVEAHQAKKTLSDRVASAKERFSGSASDNYAQLQRLRSEI